MADMHALHFGPRPPNCGHLLGFEAVSIIGRFAIDKRRAGVKYELAIINHSLFLTGGPWKGWTVAGPPSPAPGDGGIYDLI